MGGKQKQVAAQRTKGNAKPSSSAKAAELLEASGAAATGFIGFGAFTDGLGVSKSTQGSDPSTDVDVDFALVMKKLTKRDPTTKLKGMQEYATLCKEKDVEAVGAVLPFWPKIYCRLSTDHDRRVREATNIAFEQLVLRVGRQLAPHLKCIMGPWFIAQSDTHAPAATAARASFAAAFSSAKQSDAISFCKTEILSHVADYLFDQTAQTLSDPKTTEVDEMEAKYQRLLASSLDAFGLFLLTLPKDQQLSVVENLRQILKNTKFWKFGKHPLGVVRASFFGSIASLCAVYPTLADEFADQICPGVLYALDETDPSVIRPLWEAVLQVIVTIKDCWSKVNPRKGIFPKLWITLKNGGWGCAIVTHPNILPFISRLPSEITGDGNWFWERVLGSMRESLTLERVQLSPSESNAIVESFEECARYCIVQNLAPSCNTPAEDVVPPDKTDTQSLVELVDQRSSLLNYVITQQLVPLINASLTDRSPTLSSNTRLNAVVSALLLYLHRRNSSVGGETVSKVAESTDLYALLVKEISSIITTQIDKGDAVTLARIASFFEACASADGSPSTGRPMRKGISKKSVGFVTSEDLKVSKTAGSDRVLNESDMYVGKNVEGGLLEDCSGALWRLVCEACWTSLLRSRSLDMEGSSAEGYTEFFARVTLACISGNLMSFLTTKWEESTREKADPSTACFQILDGDRNSEVSVTLKFLSIVVLPHLIASGNDEETFQERKPSRGMTALMLRSFERLGIAEKHRVLRMILTGMNTRSVEDPHRFSLVESMTAQYRGGSVGEWWRGNEFGDFIVSTADELMLGFSRRSSEVEVEGDLTACDSARLRLLCAVLSVNEDNKPFIEVRYIEKLLVKISEALGLSPPTGVETTHNDLYFNRCISLACDMAACIEHSLPDCLSLPSSENLLLTLFKICFHPDAAAKKVSPESMSKSESTWSECFRSLPHLRDGEGECMISDGSVVARHVDSLKSAVCDSLNSVHRLSTLARMTVSLKDVLFECCPTESLVPLLSTMMERLHVLEFDPSTLAPLQALLFVRGALLFPTPPVLSSAIMRSSDIVAAVAPVCFASEILLSFIKPGGCGAAVDVTSCSEKKIEFYVSNEQNSEVLEAAVGGSGDVTEVESKEQASLEKITTTTTSDQSLTQKSMDSEAKETNPQIEKQTSEPVVTNELDERSVAEAASPIDTGAISTSFATSSVGSKLIMNITVALSCCSVLETADSSSVSLSEEFARFSSLLKINFQKILSSLTTESRMTILARSFERSVSDGHLWSLGFGTLLTSLCSIHPDWDFLEVVGKGDGVDRLCAESAGVHSTLQVAMPFLKSRDLNVIAQTRTAYVMTCDVENITKFDDGCIGNLAVLSAALSVPITNLTDTSPMIDIIRTVFTHIGELREKHDSIFIFDVSSLADYAYPTVAFNVELIRFISAAVRTHPTVLTALHWDTVLCSAVSWLQTFACETRDKLESDLSALTFGVATLDLISCVAQCVQTVLPTRPGDFPPELAVEWKELFSGSVFNLVLPLFIEVAESSATSVQVFPELLRSVSAAVVYCPIEYLKAHQLRARLVASDVTPIPDNLQTLLNTLCPLLATGRKRCVQIAAYRLLEKFISELSSYDGALVSPDSAEDDKDVEVRRSPPRALVSALNATRRAFSPSFDGREFGETVLLPHGTAEHSGAMGHLFAWSLLLRFFGSATMVLRSEYAAWLCEHGSIEHLMRDIFHLMPNVASFSSASLSTSLLVAWGMKESLFTDEPRLNVDVLLAGRTIPRDGGEMIQTREDYNELQHLTCFVYLRALESLPAVIRRWWSIQGKAISAIVDRFTARHVSPLLCARELSTVSLAASTMSEGMTVKARPSTNEVVATYVKEESQMELVITLPLNLPFGTISVDSGRKFAIEAKQWRTWMLQLVIFLTYQNGSIIDGLALWKQNVDKRFEGLDDCMICFSVIHASTSALPKLQCKTCRKRFHSICLYKWFSTSHNSACPLCRNLF